MIYFTGKNHDTVMERKLFRAVIKDGSILYESPGHLSVWLKANPGPCEIIFSPPRYLRSRNQNAYYYGVVLDILSETTGYDKEEMHEILKMKFLSSPKEIGDESVTVTRSTASLKTDEMERFLSNVREWASRKLQTYIPLPNEQQD